MGFGYGVGDIVVLAQLAWKAYRSCKDAPESFGNISHEVLSLHALLKEVEENLSSQTLSLTRQARLKTIGDGCRNVLEELQSLVDKYESLGTQSKRAWDRMKWGSTDIAELRSRLTSNTLLLTAFISTTQVVIEKKLDKFLQEFQDGKHEGSVITAQTVESLSTDEKQTWRIIRKELEDIGITVAAFDANRDFIMNWFKAAIATGAFEEQTLEDASSTQTREDDLGRLWEDPQHPTADQFVTGLFDPLTVQNIPTRNPVAFGVQSTQTVITQKATSPAFLPIDGLSTSAKTPHMQVIQKAPQKAPTRRERVPRVAALIAWVFRYDKDLINSASEGREAVVQRLLEKGANVNATDYHGRTALHLAADKGHEAVVQRLLEKGADVNVVVSYYDRTALHEAAENGHKAVVQQLLEKGADVNAKDSYGRTALHLAADKGYEAVVQRLLEKGADVNAKGDGEETALHKAAENGHRVVVQQLLEKGADVNAKDYDGRTALHLAADKGHETVVQWLLEKRADVNAKGGYNSRTVLHLAANKGHEAIVQRLLEEGADVGTKDCYKRTALHSAAKNGHRAVVQQLLEKGADVNAEDYDGRTALHLAAENGHKAVVQQLLEKGADVNAKDYDGRTALHLAAKNGHKAVVQQLLEKGADVNAESDYGRTALHLAAKNGHKAVVQQFLEKGADVNAESDYGH